MRIVKLLFGLLLLTIISGCEGFFGEETDLSFIDKPEYQGREVAYVPIQPVLSGFVKPTQVVTGFDELLYVVDEGTGQIVSFDLSGRELDRVSVKGLKSIAQDRAFDILAIGTYDTSFQDPKDTSQLVSLTLSCVYRINQKRGSALSLSFGTPEAVIIHPYYLGFKTASESDEAISFTGVATLSDNSYYLTRTGPSNNPLQLGGPDDAVLSVIPDLNGVQDKRISPIAVQTGAGFENDYFSMPSSITTLSQPPQDPAVSSSKDFIYTSINPDLALKVQYIKYEETLDGGIYSLKEMASSDTSKADGFLYDPGKFATPEGVTYAGDRTNYIFVVDATKDSLYQFTNEGYEGANPPPFSANRKQIQVSFGGNGLGLNQFNKPMGVAYFKKIVYVADAGNGRVLRFKLTSDFE
ncbi:MAG: hypothetical protein CL840_10245 [Crocinitomicaceae bacterium]|nr:hypothetical protein [Crocinitomicaceae bacterium]|tara:strand:- start:3583 stop:4812 length:1230 start_codon:yes stop_codon:yes gene_type:complete